MANGLKVLLWNAHSVKPKDVELHDLAEREEAQVITITETHLKPGVNFCLPGYNTVRLDRTATNGGGVAIAVKQPIKFVIQPDYRTSVIEAVGVEIATPDGPLLVIAAYCPQQCYEGSGKARQFKNDLVKLTRHRKKFIVACDLNAKHEAWGNHRRNKNGNLLFDESQLGYFVVNAPKDPTFLSPAGIPACLDFFLTNMEVPLPTTINELSSDHLPVLLRVGGDAERGQRRTRKDYHRVNWVVFQRKVDSRVDAEVQLDTVEDIDLAVENLQAAIVAAESECVPRVQIVSSQLQFDPELRSIMRARNVFRRQFQRTGDLSKKSQANYLTKIIALRVQEMRNDRFERDVRRMDPFSRPFWKVAKILKSKPQQIPPLKCDENLLVSPLEKANAIASSFSKNHLIGSHLVSPMEQAVSDTLLTLNNTPCYVPDNKKISVEEVSAAIKGAKNMKAPGFDTIFNLVLKNLSVSALSHIANIFNRCLDLNYFPNCWKLAKVVPILKPGKDPTSPKSYRPISLLSALSKLFEKVILNRVLDHVNNNNILLQEQFGFRKGHSTSHQLYRVTNIINKNKSVAKSTVMGLLDVEKAFDNVWHDGLVYKLYRYNFPNYLIKIIQHYLKDRQFRVALSGELSDSLQIPAGVPQGSLLGPILYSIYTSDVPQLPDGCYLSLFADDTAIMVKGRNTRTTVKKLQECLNSFQQYASLWKIKLNAAKTQVIVFPYNRSPKLLPPDDCKIVMDGVSIDWSTDVLYLGLTIDQKLLFRSHVEKTKTKCNKIVKALYPLINRRSKLCLKNKIAIFKQIISPVIDYAMPVWQSTAMSHRKTLQIVQNKALKMILNVPYHTKNTEVHDIAGVQMLDQKIIANFDKFKTKCQQSEYAMINTLFQQN